MEMLMRCEGSRRTRARNVRRREGEPWRTHASRSARARSSAVRSSTVSRGVGARRSRGAAPACVSAAESASAARNSARAALGPRERTRARTIASGAGRSKRFTSPRMPSSMPGLGRYEQFFRGLRGLSRRRVRCRWGNHCERASDHAAPPAASQTHRGPAGHTRACCNSSARRTFDNASMRWLAALGEFAWSTVHMRSRRARRTRRPATGSSCVSS